MAPAAIPSNRNRFEINFDLLDHKLIVTASSSKERDFDLADGLNVSTFYHQLFNILDGLDINALIKARPYDIKPNIPFAEDTFHKSYTKNTLHAIYKSCSR